MVWTVPAFVAQRPSEYAGVVLVAPYHSLYPLHVCVEPLFAAAHDIIVSMVFYICFIKNPDAKAVAKIIPSFIVRVVACPHCIEIEILEEHYVVNHFFRGQGFCRVLVVLVAVYTVYVDFLFVQQKFSVFYFY